MSQQLDIAAVFRQIEQQNAQAIADLIRFCAQPSVATDNRGMAEMLEITRARLEQSNFAVEVVPLEGGFPVLYAESRDEVPADAPILLIYNHYDVQPEGDHGLWTSPPYEPTIRDGKLFARGVSDNKGNLIARLAAVDALRAVDGKLPLKIKWIVEGEEEIGSPSLNTFLESYKSRLTADGCIWEFGNFSAKGVPTMFLGLKGILMVELRSSGPNRDLHSSLASSVGSPTWRLVWALNTLKDENEYVAIDGFYDQLRPPSTTELDMVAALPDDDVETLRNLGLAEFAAGIGGYQRRLAEVFSPTCNIQGITAGYGGPGSKTILPARASAKLDLRLVPDQDPNEILQLLRDHLSEKGFSDIEVVAVDGSLYPARTDPDHPFVQIAREVCEELAGNEKPIISPSSPASGPMYSFTNMLGLPVIAIGVAYHGSANHAPNENIRLTDFEQGTKMIALLIRRMAEAGAARFRNFDSPALEEYPTEYVANGIYGAGDLFTGLPELDLASIEAEMAGGIAESRLLPATRRPEVGEALEEVEKAQELADKLMEEEA